MTFLHPSILWALIALAVPVLIHLFYFRRYKRINFSDTRFLQEAKRIQTSTNRLKHLLVLASRLLALAALILAFAQPFLQKNPQQVAAQSHVSLFIDNSHSMQAQGAAGSLLSMAKQEAEQVVNAYPEYTRYHVYDHSFASEDQRWVSKEQAISKIRQTEAHIAHRDIGEISGRQRQMQDRSQGEKTALILFTDGQDNVFDQTLESDTSRPLSIVRLSPIVAGNIVLDSAWFGEPVVLPGRSTPLYTRVVNQSNHTRHDLSVQLEIDGQSRPSGTFDLAPMTTYVDTLIVSIDDPGWHDLTLRIQDGSIHYDDRIDMTTFVRSDASVLLIHDGQRSSIYAAAFAAMEQATLDRITSDQVVYSAFKDYDLIIIDDLPQLTSGQVTALEQYVTSGGSVAIFPSSKMDAGSYNALLQPLGAAPYGRWIEDTIAVTKVNTSSFVFDRVYRQLNKQLQLPTAFGYWRSGTTIQGDRDILLTLRNGAPALQHFNRGAGHLYTSALSTDDRRSELIANGGIFIPMLHRMSLRAGSGLHSYYTIGKSNVLSIRTPRQQSDEPYRLTGPAELIPRQREGSGRMQFFISDEITEPGSYTLMQGDIDLGRAAFVYDRSESVSEYLSQDQLQARVGAHTNIMDRMQEGNMAQAMIQGSRHHRWIYWLLLLALVALGLEQLLLRHYPRS